MTDKDQARIELLDRCHDILEAGRTPLAADLLALSKVALRAQAFVDATRDAMPVIDQSWQKVEAKLDLMFGDPLAPWPRLLQVKHTIRDPQAIRAALEDIVEP